MLFGGFKRDKTYLLYFPGTTQAIWHDLSSNGNCLRPHPGTKNRPIFNWAHWAVGNSAFILGQYRYWVYLKISTVTVS